MEERERERAQRAVHTLGFVFVLFASSLDEEEHGFFAGWGLRLGGLINATSLW